MSEKVALITGASSGIGRSTAKLFVNDGWSVVGVGRNQHELTDLRTEVRDAAGKLRSHLADLTETSQIDRLVSDTLEHLGRIDVLVNAAGIIKNGNIADTSLLDWDRMMEINLRSVFYLMHKCVPSLERTKGNIVNVSSVAGTRAFPNVLAYCVSKAAVDQLTRCAALELAPKGVRVNAVNPGVVVTNLHKRGGMESAAYEKFIEHSKSTHPIGRTGTPDEVADLVFYLASDKASWITGATYEIDGGRGQTCAR
ncbi:MAG TPA: glucose 1-dehydrogenase [Pyrinomonadaceae bacterium]|jgi:NAD(P)-dependent dehydrogenase (short-subunit alcohol dehydrogenase family)|nr:glucose 1-dehydrogenase [Pyrinomonadaceae bacterium]